MLTVGVLSDRLNVRPATANHRIQGIARTLTLGGHVFSFSCRCGHETNGYVRPLDALGLIEAHMIAAEAREKEERGVGSW